MGRRAEPSVGRGRYVLTSLIAPDVDRWTPTMLSPSLEVALVPSIQQEEHVPHDSAQPSGGLMRKANVPIRFNSGVQRGCATRGALAAVAAALLVAGSASSALAVKPQGDCPGPFQSATEAQLAAFGILDPAGAIAALDKNGDQVLCVLVGPAEVRLDFPNVIDNTSR